MNVYRKISITFLVFGALCLVISVIELVNLSPPISYYFWGILTSVSIIISAAFGLFGQWKAYNNEKSKSGT